VQVFTNFPTQSPPVYRAARIRQRVVRADHLVTEGNIGPLAEESAP
jgi:hypothetical protein